MNTTAGFLALQEQAPAQPAQPTQQQDGRGPGSDLLSMVLPLVLIFAVFYFILIRPQRRQQKEREAMLSQIKKNDHVVTSGGILGIVDRVKENEVILKIDEKGDVRIRVLRNAIVDIRKVSGAAGEETKAEAPEEPEKK